MSLSYPDAVKFLYGLRIFGANFGLTSPAALAARVGNPEQHLRFVHVAGTNGKGSTCAMLESIYRAAGLRVGLFTSPHLVSFCERIQVNRRPISEAEVVALVERLQPLMNASAPDHPTFFEVVMVMALLHFAAERCDLVIWETGLGGRLDATNIVTPLACVLTTIDFDHEKWLGHTLAEIAHEKAGIIKRGVPVIAAEGPEEVARVIEHVAMEQQAPLTLVSALDADRLSADGLQVSLSGDHQRLNSALAVSVVRALSQRIPVSRQALHDGLKQVIWPGRLQMIRPRPEQQILLDGAHNPSGAQTLRVALEQNFPGQKTFVLGLLSDKDCAGICRILAPLAARILTTPVDSERSASPVEVAALCRRFAPSADITSCSTLAEAWRLAASDPFIVVTGSLHFLGEVMEMLAPPAHQGERGLNEWVNPRF
jgi:dihydrofolate synthase/folylpolyglutamate synthase